MSAVRASVRALASSANFLTVSFMVLNPLVAAATGFGAALRVLLDWGAIVFWAAVLGAALRATGFAVFFWAGRALAFTVLVFGASPFARAGATALAPAGAAGATGLAAVSSVAASKAFSRSDEHTFEL